MPREIGVQVRLAHSPDTFWSVRLEHYEQLRDHLDQGDTGWIELRHVHGDGKVFCRLEDVVELFYAGPAYTEQANALDREDDMGMDVTA